MFVLPERLLQEKHLNNMKVELCVDGSAACNADIG